MESRQQLLIRNLGFGAVLGAGIGVLHVVSTQVAPNNGMLLGAAVGGAIGGAVLIVLVSSVLRWLLR